MIQSAPFWKRATAHIIDFVIITLLISMPLSMYQKLETTSSVNSILSESLSQLFILILTIWFWRHYQGTPGKMILKLKIVGYEGEELGVKQSVVRYFSYMISLIPLGLGFLWCLYDNEGRCWHDMLSKTKVIEN